MVIKNHQRKKKMSNRITKAVSALLLMLSGCTDGCVTDEFRVQRKLGNALEEEWVCQRKYIVNREEVFKAFKPGNEKNWVRYVKYEDKDMSLSFYDTLTVCEAEDVIDTCKREYQRREAADK